MLENENLDFDSACNRKVYFKLSFIILIVHLRSALVDFTHKHVLRICLSMNVVNK